MLRHFQASWRLAIGECSIDSCMDQPSNTCLTPEQVQNTELPYSRFTPYLLIKDGPRRHRSLAELDVETGLVQARGHRPSASYLVASHLEPMPKEQQGSGVRCMTCSCALPISFAFGPAFALGTYCGVLRLLRPSTAITYASMQTRDETKGTSEDHCHGRAVVP